MWLLSKLQLRSIIKLLLGLDYKVTPNTDYLNFWFLLNLPSTSKQPLCFLEDPGISHPSISGTKILVFLLISLAAIVIKGRRGVPKAILKKIINIFIYYLI